MRKKKMVSVLLALSLMLGVCACGSQSKDSQESAPKGEEQKTESGDSQTSDENSSDSSEPAGGTDGQVTLRIAVNKHPSDVSDNADFAKYKLMLRKAEEDLGYKIEWQPAIDQEKVATMLTGDLPDVFWGVLSDSQITDNTGLFLPLEDKIEDYAPNVYALYDESVPDWKEFLTYPDGHIYSMMGGTLVNPLNAISGTMWINQKWLEQLNLDIPETMEELENVLIAFRDNDCDGDGDASNEIPFDWCHKHWASRYVELAHSFGLPLGGGYYDIVDGKIVSIVDSDQYRRFLEEYHRLTAEGLVNIEGATQTDEQYNSNISGGKVGVFIGWAPYTYISDEELKSQYVPMPLVSAEGTTPRLQANLNGASRNCYVITTACQNVEAAMKLWDYFSQDEAGSFATAYGEEGLVWEYVDGEPTNRIYTAEEATEMGYGEIASNAGTSTFAATVGMVNAGPLMLKSRTDPSGTNGAVRWSSVKNYEPYYMEQTMSQSIIPADANEEFSFTTDGLSEYIDTFACDSILNGITDEGWNAYVSGLSQYGYEYYLEFQQKHLDNAF